MAYCPNERCPKEWLWDWEVDILCNKDGDEPQSTQTKTTPNIDATIFRCTCGEFLGVIIVSELELTLIPCEAWKDIDWELSEHSF